ncbi:MAG: NAD(+) kinase [Gammaproteobacteria bacterium]|jgi:NAD+ kinase|nr:NAD(+) kinase [Gammaproteobacteria bacterium]
MKKFERVGLVARMGSPPVLESLKTVEHFLRSQSVEVVMEDLAAEMLGETDLQVCSQEELGSHCDLAIAVGGDGVILGAARTLAPSGIPLLGINRGSLGFLADVSPDEIELRVGEVLDGDYSIEEHFLLEGEVSVAGQEVPCALNEVTIHASTVAKMIEFDLFINDQFVYNQNSDGLIVSSPTGSTAYALSAGGPIMHPSLDAIVLIPMFPHTLSSRPLVVPGNSELKIVIGSGFGEARVSFDSHLVFEVHAGESIIIRKKEEKLKLIHPPGHSFYGVCRSKLDWASRVGD